MSWSEELGCEIIDHDWDHYDFGHAVMNTPTFTAFEIEGHAKRLLVDVNRESPTMQSMLRLLTR